MANKYGRATEAEVQAALFQWSKYYPELKYMFAVPNGGSRDLREAINLKIQGVRAGVPDICLPVPKEKYHGLYIELKVERNKPSDNQKMWIEYLNGVGYKAVVCYGFDEAQRTLIDYISSK